MALGTTADARAVIQLYAVLMETQSTKSATFYGVWLFLAWTLYVALIYPFLPTERPVAGILLGELFRIVIFIVPIVLLIWSSPTSKLVVLRLMPPTYRDMAIGVIVSVAWVCLTIGGALTIQQKSISYSPSIAFWIVRFSVAATIEELTFRSYFLQVLQRHGSLLAVVVSSVLFVCIHFPGWYLLEMLPTTAAWISTPIPIFTLGCLLGILFLRTTSIWPCVFLHVLNNLTSMILTTAI